MQNKAELMAFTGVYRRLKIAADARRDTPVSLILYSRKTPLFRP